MSSQPDGNDDEDESPAAEGDRLLDPQRHERLYRGASGQMAVMSEFLYRLMNVAIPEVDIGDDIFVVRERDETVTRVQVKYSKAELQASGSYVAQFNLPWEQLDRDDSPALVYVLAVRHQDRWSDFIVIRRFVLRRLQADPGLGAVIQSEGRTYLRLRLVFTTEDVRARHGASLHSYRNAFLPWPPPSEPDGELSGEES